MIFVDAGLFYARLSADDENHAAADLFFTGLGLAVPLVTTNVVLYEAHALLLRLSLVGRRVKGATPARRFLQQIDAGLCSVEHINGDDHRVARQVIDTHDDKGFSCCDALSFVVMERLGVEIAASFDRHFKQYGKFAVFP